MSNPFFERPILNSPYESPRRHWELDADGQPTQKTIETRRRAEFITPIPKPKKRRAAVAQQDMVFDEGRGLSTTQQQYDATSIINELRQHVDQWRTLPESQWQVTPETGRLLHHWRHYLFNDVRPFFCQVEAAETAIWLTEVAPQSKAGKRLLEHLANANKDANPELMRLALKLATGAGNPNARVLLTTFSHVLANALRTQLRRLISNEPRLAERLEVHSIDAIGERLYKSLVGPVSLAPRLVVQDLLRTAGEQVANHKFNALFLLTEWEQVVDAWQLDTWEAYRDVVRLGRKTRLPEPQRAVLWSIFERVRAGLVSRKMTTRSGMFTKLATAVGASRNPPFDCAVVDEAQDMGVAHLRFFASLGQHRPDALFFAGDLGQRIFQQPFSWLALGVDIRGRSKTLKVNYRTSHQIRANHRRGRAHDLAPGAAKREQGCWMGPADSSCCLPTARGRTPPEGGRNQDARPSNHSGWGRPQLYRVTRYGLYRFRRWSAANDID